MLSRAKLTSHSDSPIYLKGPDLTRGSRCGYVFNLREGVTCVLNMSQEIASDDKEKDPLSFDYTNEGNVRIQESCSLHLTRAKDIVKCVIKLESEPKPEIYPMYASENQHLVLKITRPRKNISRGEFKCWEIRQI
eukprot:TRINITY_DN1525_c0_g2_i2.p1 TRINITY_DN1525_c0_g2~~TRINITY_DN1525_c0_g2_i2.p1  ORF type:complete len:135 (+),score=6.85 TRINITY_DN1525_c0_g2_i2:305-709(+)